MFVKADPNSPLVWTRNMTVLGRQQPLQHKILYVKGPRSAVVMALFEGCVEQDKGNGHFSPSMYTTCLLPCRSWMLSAVPAQGSGSPPFPFSGSSCCCFSFKPGTVLLPGFLIWKQNHWVCPNKITLVVFAPTCSLHASPTPCCTILPGLPTHLWEYFPVFSPCFTPFCTFKCNLCATIPASHQSPCLGSPAERLWRWMRSFGIFYKEKCDKHTDYLLPRGNQLPLQCTTHQKAPLIVAAKSPQSRCITAPSGAVEFMLSKPQWDIRSYV